MNSAVAFFKRIVGVVGSAMILVFFSEFYFINEGPAETVITTLATQPFQLIAILGELLLYYGLFAYIFLITIERFNIRTIWGLFLAGVIFGWATEGLVVPIIYEAVPFSFVFPSISWHALVDVLFGWYVISYVMRMNRVSVSIGFFAVLGVIWAFWATWFWVDTSPTALAPITPDEFVGFAFSTSVIWILGMIVFDYSGYPEFSVSKVEVWVVLVISILLYIGMAIVFLPFSLAFVPVLAITLFALWRGRKTSTESSITRMLGERKPKAWQYLTATLVPITATLVYPSVYNNQWVIPSEDITALLLVGGFVVYVIAMYKTLRQRVQ